MIGIVKFNSVVGEMGQRRKEGYIMLNRSLLPVVMIIVICGILVGVSAAAYAGTNGPSKEIGLDESNLNEAKLPANDKCENAIVVEEGAPYVGSTLGATGVSESSCGENDTGDVWHLYRPESTGVVTISLCGSDFDTTMAIYYDGCGGTELTCNDDLCGVQSGIVLSVTAGDTYLIRVAGFGGEAGDYTLTIGRPPANDDCPGAIEVMEGVPYNGSTIGALGVFESSCGENDRADVWHSYTPASTGLATISLAGSTFDTTLAVFDGCGGTELVCGDDSCESLQSAVVINLEGGSTYLIRVAGYNGEAGDYILTVISKRCVSPSEPNSPSPADGVNGVPLDTILSWDGSNTRGGGNKAVWTGSKDTITPKVIYGDDDRRDEYEVTDESILAAGDATAALIWASGLIDNGDGTFSLPSETYGDWYERVDPIGTGNPLCSDEPFRDQPKLAFCSGFLVAPDIIATAGHCVCAGECGTVAVVFGFVMLDSETPALRIDGSEIYYCRDVIASQTGESDWALVRLDREVTGHRPLEVRTEGVIPDGEGLVVIGHPAGLPRKYAGGATVRDNTAAAYFAANLDAYVGSSGSVVVNADSLLVEGIAARGSDDFVEAGLCDRSNVCPDSAGCPEWEEVTRATEFSSLLQQSYDVYFDNKNPPTDLLCSDTDLAVCDPTPEPGAVLKPCTRYYWRVVSRGFCGQSEGRVWSFTTVSVPGDLDRDCDVDFSDLAILALHWLQNAPELDITAPDDIINFADFAVLAESWLWGDEP